MQVNKIDLGERVAVITGAAQGIGFATAERFIASGAKVVIWDINTEATERARKDLESRTKRPVHGYRVDIADYASVTAAADRTVADLGRIDILINNAGLTQPLKLMEVTPENWQLVVDVNLTGVLYLSQAFIPHMRTRKQGSIACMSSVSAQRGGGIFGGPHYSAAKAGVLGLAKAMARELGPDGIRVNSVTPGLIQTDITGDKLTPEMKAEIIKGIPISRLGDAKDVANVYLFLASDLSAYITGAVIDVNGGMLIH
jgi:NAD(P)-dependent dehydrogenase (short-subunit alcohol dehydrogenase family)